MPPSCTLWSTASFLFLYKKIAFTENYATKLYFVIHSLIPHFASKKVAFTENYATKYPSPLRHTGYKSAVICCYICICPSYGFGYAFWVFPKPEDKLTRSCTCSLAWLHTFLNRKASLYFTDPSSTECTAPPVHFLAVLQCSSQYRDRNTTTAIYSNI